MKLTALPSKLIFLGKYIHHIVVAFFYFSTSITTLSFSQLNKRRWKQFVLTDPY
jgi:hypothetical protein